MLRTGKMSNPRLALARILAIAGLVLFSIYFIDEAAKDGGTVGGFLPVSNPMARGVIFELPSLALSAAAFALTWSGRSVLTSVVLLVTGALMILDGVLIGTRFFVILNLPGPVIGFVYGLAVLTLGIIKSVRTFGANGAPSFR
jgi:hypothetical protein